MPAPFAWHKHSLLLGVRACTPRALEVSAAANKRCCSDMQDVYHACLAAVCAPPIPRMSNVCPFAWHKHSLLLGVRACTLRALEVAAAANKRSCLDMQAGRMPAWRWRACTLVFTCQHLDTRSPTFIVVRNWSGPNT